MYTPNASDYTLGQTATVYVQATSTSGCQTALMPVTFTVNAVPTNLSYYGNLLYCKGQTVMIVPSVSNIDNITYQWSLTSNFAQTSILGSNYVDLNGNLTYKTNSVGSTTYYLRAINSVSGCTPSVLPITVTVNIQLTNISVNKLTNQKILQHIVRMEQQNNI